MSAYGTYPDLDVVDPIERPLGFEGDMKARDGYFEGVGVGVGGGYE